MKKSFLTILLIIVATINSAAQTTETFFKEVNIFLSIYTKAGKVDYKALANNPSSLDKLVSLTKEVSLAGADVKIAQAFWINAYNMSVIKGIVANYPIKSPLDKKGFFDTIKYEIAGQKITLNDIENKKLRAKFSDARFHFVLVCGALGCPPIIEEAYMPNTLDAQLEQQTKKALNRDSFIKVSKGKVAFSEIFKWYKEDFVKDGNEIDFLNKYRKEKVASDSKVTYYSYDWRLNEK
jgi:hypothetical protein